MRATVAILPAGADALAVCDRADGDDAGAVMFPDDSSHHLIGALPRRRVERWLDVATGAALAPLSAAGRAREVVAVDLSPRAIAMARLGAALSGVPLALAVADLADGVDGGFDLVTANLPIPGERAGAGPRHRVSPPGADLIARFWRAAAARLAPGGEALLHAALDDDPLAALRALPGEVVVARYTPPGLAAFGVTAWRPDRPAARRVRDLALTRDAPHVDRAAVE
ncbi:MAG: methyltransferase [Kofleriaceae bacterium]|nr:methyltransferase [Kofleriaceae bacterium]